MAVDTDFTSLLNNLKVEDPWLPPRPWESIPTESGHTVSSTSPSSPSPSTRLYDTPTVSEASLVRLAMNALQGLESSLMTIEKLCTIFHCDPTDRTFHRIPSLWSPSVSTLALEKILRSLGRTGCQVFFLRKFVNHFTNLSWDAESDAESAAARGDFPPYSLVNQAFAVAVGGVLDGYIAAFDTLSSSVKLRRLDTTVRYGGLLTVDHSQVTLMEVYLHTKELRSQIEVIGSICNVQNAHNLDSQTKFSEFPRGGNLLTYLYMELKVADPVHCGLLKTLFIRSCEPYFEFIRSWIFKAKISDHFNEFIVAEADTQQSYSLSNTRFLVDFPSATIREQDGVSVPCFLRDSLIPLFRAGQQLQVLIKLLEFSDGIGSWNRTYEDFLPYWSKMSSSRLSDASYLAFSKDGIEKMVLTRRDYYKIMMEKLNDHLPNLEFKYFQVISHSTFPISVSNGRGNLEVSSATNDTNTNLADSDASCSMDDFSYAEDSSSEISIEDEVYESDKMVETFHDSEDVENKYLSALEFKKFYRGGSLIGSSRVQERNALEVVSKRQNQSGDALILRSWETERANLIMGTGKLRERCSKVHLPSFDFRSIRDPFTQCVDRLGGSIRGDEIVSANSTVTVRNYQKALGGDAEKNLFVSHATRGLRTERQEQGLLPDNVSGGGSWEHLIERSGGTDDLCRTGELNVGAASVIEIPLDFVLEKCLLEEIQLQYIYVSKLTIKLLEEGFCLQEHLLALRRYHMMESADWADLFIVSIWKHKWYTSETDKRISEIQGLLELAVQRSSCERDRYKDRLFVYMKENASTSLPAFTTGIQSFDVLGLGYQVDWPVSIVLTPSALKIYAQIFSFLIQVKLALSSLTEVWCSFKEFIHVTNKHRYSDLRKSEARHFNIMVKLRHQIFHFVSTLQQYVQSQLSHISWCRFLQSLKHKVKDLTDLDFVHMDYLNNSLSICFLSNDMKQISGIIQSILQCALDFRSVVGPNNSAGLSIAQVVNIKEAFNENIRQLYGCYLNSPKNVEFSLPRFWEYLNYNHHFSDVIHKEMGHHAFSF